MLRDQFARCPRCASGLDVIEKRLVCGRCNGELTPESELVDRIAAEQARAFAKPRGFSWLSPEYARLAALVRDLGPVVTSEEPPLTCPCCGSEMTRHLLCDTIVDRCSTHGVWVDGKELAKIIAAAIRNV
jgi:predicted amidophosphoribosyltransferase